MIGFLSGTVLQHDESTLIVNVSGVGYEVRPSAHVLNCDIASGQQIELYIHTHVREDQITLYGFTATDELELFRLLLSVSGIGPKSALSILGHGTPDEVKTAISTADVSFFQGISGVGKKSVQRVIVDLKSKVGGMGELDLSEKNMKKYQTLVSALRSMDISSEEIKEMIKKVDQSAPIEEQIRQALKKDNGKNG